MNTDKKAAKMEKHLLKTKFPLECEEIPQEDLNEEEKEVVNKCINHENLTDEEFTLLKATLQRYRKAIQKHKPTETIESVEKTVNIIQTEQELLDLLDSPEMKTLLVHLPINGQMYEFNFEILPLDNSRAIKSISTQLEIFKDFTKEEANIYTKAQAGQVLSAEEKAVLNHVNKELEKRSNEQQEEIIIALLASQLRLPKSNQDLEVRQRFWRKFPYNAKVSVFMKVQDRLGLTEQSNEKLFPACN